MINLTLPTYTDRESTSSFSACVAEVLDESSYMLKGTQVNYKKKLHTVKRWLTKLAKYEIRFPLINIFSPPKNR